jgi:hypothetical protein
MKEDAMWQETRRIFLESSADVLRAAARILPSVLAMLLFFGLATVLAVVVRSTVRRGCERLGLDERLREWGVAAPGVAGGSSPSRLVARVSFWAVLLAGGFLGVSVLETPAAAALSMRLVEYVPRALLALAILGAGVAAARFVERSVLIGAVNMGLQSARLIALGARWLVVLLAAAVALEHAGVGGGVVIVAFGTLFGGIVLALALAVGLGAKEVVARSLERRFPEKARDGKGAEEGHDARGRLHHL